MTLSLIPDGEIDVWPASSGGWLTAPNARGVAHVQPCHAKSTAARLVREMGVKRISYGFTYTFRFSADETGRFTPELIGSNVKGPRQE